MNSSGSKDVVNCFSVVLPVMKGSGFVKSVDDLLVFEIPAVVEYEVMLRKPHVSISRFPAESWLPANKNHLIAFYSNRCCQILNKKMLKALHVSKHARKTRENHKTKVNVEYNCSSL